MFVPTDKELRWVMGELGVRLCLSDRAILIDSLRIGAHDDVRDMVSQYVAAEMIDAVVCCLIADPGYLE